MSISGRKRKDEINLKDLIDALNNINNTLEKSPRDQEPRKDGNEDDKNPKLNIFDIVKEYWFIIPLLTFVYSIYTYIAIYYPAFNYNMPITIEYIQEQTTNGFYKWIWHSVIIAGVRLVLYGCPLWVIFYTYKSKIFKVLFPFWVVYVLSMERVSVFNITTFLTISHDRLIKDNGDSWSLWDVFLENPILNSVLILFSVFVPLVVFIFKPYSDFFKSIYVSMQGFLVYIHILNLIVYFCKLCRNLNARFYVSMQEHLVYIPILNCISIGLYDIVILLINICKLFNDIIKKIRVLRLVFLVIIFLCVVLPWVGPSYRPSFLNGGSSVSCIYGNNGEEPVEALPYKYEARGVYVFRGEIKTNSEGRQSLHDVNREFLLFEKGYKVTSGVCRQSSPSFKQPPQYSRPPQ